MLRRRWWSTFPRRRTITCRTCGCIPEPIEMADSPVTPPTEARSNPTARRGRKHVEIFKIFMSKVTGLSAISMGSGILHSIFLFIFVLNFGIILYYLRNYASLPTPDSVPRQCRAAEPLPWSRYPLPNQIQYNTVIAHHNFVHRAICLFYVIIGCVPVIFCQNIFGIF